MRSVYMHIIAWQKRETVKTWTTLITLWLKLQTFQLKRMPKNRSCMSRTMTTISIYAIVLYNICYIKKIQTVTPCTTMTLKRSWEWNWDDNTTNWTKTKASVKMYCILQKQKNDVTNMTASVTELARWLTLIEKHSPQLYHARHWSKKRFF